ncbi:MAG: GNAT family N-acetyltransferase [Anaerofustis stercorihominis]|nr:GNAT family N-acetyltransferase [Anaerofustis stercorihominis]
MDGTSSLKRMENINDWLEEVRMFADESTVPEGMVPSSQFLALDEEGTLVGAIQIRHRFNDFLEKYGGHIGYCVRPSERRKGYAKKMLEMILPYCRELGMEKVLITCLEENEASAKTIIANGGVYEYTVHEPNADVKLKRYWIKL